MKKQEMGVAESVLLVAVLGLLALAVFVAGHTKPSPPINMPKIFAPVLAATAEEAPPAEIKMTVIQSRWYPALKSLFIFDVPDSGWEIQITPNKNGDLVWYFFPDRDVKKHLEKMFADEANENRIMKRDYPAVGWTIFLTDENNDGEIEIEFDMPSELFERIQKRYKEIAAQYPTAESIDGRKGGPDRCHRAQTSMISDDFSRQ